MWIGDNFFDDPVATIGSDANDSIAQRVRGQALVGVVQMSFVTEEGFPVRDEILQVAYLRTINGRVVDLVQDTFGYSEPDPAQTRVSGPYPVLVTPRPARRATGAARRRVLAEESCHGGSFAHEFLPITLTGAHRASSRSSFGFSTPSSS